MADSDVLKASHVARRRTKDPAYHRQQVDMTTLLTVTALVLWTARRAQTTQTPDVNLTDDLAADVRRLARIEQVKRGILAQLGLSEPPIPDHRGSTNMSTDAMTSQEMRSHVITTYRRSLQQTSFGSAFGRWDGEDGNTVHESERDAAYSSEKWTPAKRFYSFNAQPSKEFAGRGFDIVAVNCIRCC